MKERNHLLSLLKKHHYYQPLASTKTEGKLVLGLLLEKSSWYFIFHFSLCLFQQTFRIFHTLQKTVVSAIDKGGFRLGTNYNGKEQRNVWLDQDLNLWPQGFKHSIVNWWLDRELNLWPLGFKHSILNWWLDRDFNLWPLGFKPNILNFFATFHQSIFQFSFTYIYRAEFLIKSLPCCFLVCIE